MGFTKITQNFIQTNNVKINFLFFYLFRISQSFSDKDCSKLSITLGVNVFIRLFQIVNVLQKQAFKVVKSYRLNDHNEADFMNLILKNFHR